MDGVEATRRIVSDDPAIRVLVLTTFDLDEYAFGALRAGASGFLLKDVPPERAGGRYPDRRLGRCRGLAQDHPPPSRRMCPSP